MPFDFTTPVSRPESQPPTLMPAIHPLCVSGQREDDYAKQGVIYGSGVRGGAGEQLKR